MADVSPWAFGWTAIAGIATALLAGFTAWLAFSTRALARETDQDIRAAWRPILTPTAAHMQLKVTELRDEDRFHVWVHLTLVNTGRGPAMNCDVGGRKPRSVSGITWESARISSIPAGQETFIDLAGSASLLDGPSWHEKQRHAFVVTYEDIARNRYRSTFVMKGSPVQNAGEEGMASGLFASDVEVEDLGEKATRRGWPR